MIDKRAEEHRSVRRQGGFTRLARSRFQAYLHSEEQEEGEEEEEAAQTGTGNERQT
jgi:hypothetical protein